MYLDVGPDLSAHVDDLKGNVLPLAIAVEEADQHTASAQGETHGAHAAAGACQWQVSTAEPDTLCSARALATRALATRELPNKLRVSNSKSRILRNPLMRAEAGFARSSSDWTYSARRPSSLSSVSRFFLSSAINLTTGVSILSKSIGSQLPHLR